MTDCDYCEMQDHRRASAVSHCLAAISGALVTWLICWAF